MYRLLFFVFSLSLLNSCQSSSSIDKDAIARAYCDCQKPLAQAAEELLSMPANKMMETGAEELIDRLEALTDTSDSCMDEVLDKHDSELDAETQEMIFDLMKNKHCPETVRVIERLADM